MPPRPASDGWILLPMVLTSEKEGRGMDGRVGNGRRRQAVRVPGRKEAAEEGEYSFDMREQAEAKAGRLQL